MVDRQTRARERQGQNSLKPRAVSVAVFVPLTLIAVWLGGWIFVATLMVAAVVMTWEWNRLTATHWKTVGAGFQVVALLGVLWLAHGGLTQVAFAVLVASAFVSGLLAHLGGRSAIWGFLALLYLGPALISLIWLRKNTVYGMEAIIWLLVLIWLCDTGAYFAGKNLGGPKLAPAISPNKTWSGAIGGAIAGGLVGAGAAHIQGWGTIPIMGAMGVGLAAWAQFGDLMESAVKRRFGAKDSGTLLPGHGGLLDRLDSLLFAAPVAAAAAYWLA
ncbi:MAG: phosphatidate cytidylyltransferase [Sphingomonadales bacterium]